MNKKIITPGIALSKAQAYCAYQERSHDEVRKKLWEWEIDNEIAENIIVELINDGFINESRFAESYARGKFRIKKWGKQKIKAALRQKKVTEKCISEALSKINMSDYQEVINEIAVKKLSEYKGDKLIINKTAAYLIQRGFESELIWADPRAGMMRPSTPAQSAVRAMEPVLRTSVTRSRMTKIGTRPCSKTKGTKSSMSW